MSLDTSADEAEGRWLSYPELSSARGIDKQSAIRLATRRGWRRRKNNSGQMQVFVPAEEIKSRAMPPDVSSDKSADMSTDISRIVSGFAAAIASLTERAQAAERLLGEAMARADASHIRAEELRTESEQARKP